MDGKDTGFEDKQGKPIHYGDILQVGPGPSNRMRVRVIRFGKKTQLINVEDTENKYGGYDLTDGHARSAVIIEHFHSPL